MNPDVGSKPNQQPRSEAEKSALGVSQNLFRAFLLAALGAFFVFSLNVDYVWLSAILTLAALVLGIVVLVRTLKHKHPKLMLFGTISGLVVTAVMCLLDPDIRAFLQPGQHVPGLLTRGAHGIRQDTVPDAARELNAGAVAVNHPR